MTIVELQNKIVGYEARIAELMTEATDENVREAKAIEGRLSECRDMLMAEAKRVAEENIDMKASAKPVAEPTFIERVLGPKASFTELTPGWKVTVDTAYAPSALPIPEKYDTNLPGAVRLPVGVVSTLPQARTNEAEHYFQQPAFDNKAAAWTSGNGRWRNFSVTGSRQPRDDRPLHPRPEAGSPPLRQPRVDHLRHAADGPRAGERPARRSR